MLESEDDDFVLETEDFVAVSRMMTSRLLDRIGVSSVLCLRFFSELAGLGVSGLSCSKDSLGRPQGVTAVGVLGCCLSFGVGAALAPATLLPVVLAPAALLLLVVTVLAIAVGVGRSRILE